MFQWLEDVVPKGCKSPPLTFPAIVLLFNANFLHH